MRNERIRIVEPLIDPLKKCYKAEAEKPLYLLRYDD
jgi:hypothetical protein